MTLQALEPRKPYHPKMSELRSTIIRNDNGTCACDGCDEMATARRITRKGWFLIFYCGPHEIAASDLFGLERYEAVS